MPILLSINFIYHQSIDLNYSKQLIKGKITEHVFQEMFGVSKKLTILSIGYE